MGLYILSLIYLLLIFLKLILVRICPHHSTKPALISVTNDPHFAGSLDQFSEIPRSHHTWLTWAFHIDHSLFLAPFSLPGCYNPTFSVFLWHHRSLLLHLLLPHLLMLEAPQTQSLILHQHSFNQTHDSKWLPNFYIQPRLLSWTLEPCTQNGLLHIFTQKTNRNNSHLLFQTWTPELYPQTSPP